MCTPPKAYYMIMFTVVYPFVVVHVGQVLGGIPLTDKGARLWLLWFFTIQVELYDCGKLTWNKGSRLKKAKVMYHLTTKAVQLTHSHTQCEVRVRVHV